MSEKPLMMRDVFIKEIYDRMKIDRDIFFLSADFGAPMLDQLRADYPDRFLNVGIAEQNLINMSAGLALEGFAVYAYGIAPFLTMRAYEQIRISLALLSGLRPMNVNLIGVGAGLSYDVSGPTHHCLEDISVIRTLPHIELYSPSDTTMLGKFAEYSRTTRTPKYLRFDGKALPRVYDAGTTAQIADGFQEIVSGRDAVIVATGYMTHKALMAAQSLEAEGMNIGVVDAYLLKPVDDSRWMSVLGKYPAVLSVEEGFRGKGGLDSLVSRLIADSGTDIKFKSMGFGDDYVFGVGNRDILHRSNKMGEDEIAGTVKALALR